MHLDIIYVYIHNNNYEFILKTDEVANKNDKHSLSMDVQQLVVTFSLLFLHVY
jgi:hypothetical protein